MIAPSLLEILVCPESHQRLREADSALLERLNRAISAGSLRSRSGEVVGGVLDGALVREDGAFLYPVRDGIPVMLVDQAIPIEGLA